ncbi:unnamed protein product, partial [marine sediment metagenome]
PINILNFVKLLKINNERTAKFQKDLKNTVI